MNTYFDYIFDVNYFRFTRDGLELDQILRGLDANNLKIEPSKVAENNKMVINESIRKSFIMSNQPIDITINYGLNGYHYASEKIDTLIKTVMPKYLHGARYNLFEPDDKSSLSVLEEKWDLLIYESGGFFSKHTDSKKFDNHYGTILLLPPKSLNNYKGGELILFDGSVEHIIEPNPVKWKLVGFPVNVYHELRPVISGRRLVFKNKLLIPEYIYNLYRSDTNHRIDTDLSTDDIVDKSILLDRLYEVEVDIDEHNDKIEKYTQKIANTKKNLATLSAEQTEILYQINDGCEELMSEIDDSEINMHIIILKRRYTSTNPQDLIGIDRRLFYFLAKKLNLISINLVNYTIKSTIHTESDTDIDIDPNNHAYTQNIIDTITSSIPYISSRRHYQIHTQYRSNTDIPGKLEYITTKYNDDVYNIKYAVSVSAIVLMKA